MERYVLWQNLPSIHQAAFVSALSRISEQRVRLVVEAPLNRHRSGMGWTLPDFGTTEMIVAPGDAQVRALIDEHSGPDDVHLLSGIHAYRLVRGALPMLRRTDAKLGVMSEAGPAVGLRRHVARVRTVVDSLMYGRDLDFILAIGQRGVDWYTRSGFRRDRVFPFAYFTDPAGLTTTTHREGASFRIAYVGSLLRPKGVDILIHALGGLTNEDWELTLVGDGPERPDLERLARAQIGGDRVRWAGTRDNAAAREVIESSDLLVLPSRGDGWGVVVNEALVAGVPVVCSDACGAADVVIHSGFGSVVPSDSVQALRGALAHWIQRGPQSAESREQIRMWSNRISGESGAQYFRSVVACTRGERTRPQALWLASPGAGRSIVTQ